MVTSSWFSSSAVRRLEALQICEEPWSMTA